MKKNNMLKFIDLIEKEVPQDDSADIGEKLILYSLIRACKPNMVVETGTHKGKTSLYMAHALYDNGKGKMYTADPFEWGALGNIRKFPELEKICTYKKVKGKDLKVKDIDFLFIDGFHTKQDVLDEFKHFQPRLTKNAIVVFHDCHKGNEPDCDVNGGVKELGLKTVWIPTLNRMRIYENSNY